MSREVIDGGIQTFCMCGKHASIIKVVGNADGQYERTRKNIKVEKLSEILERK